MMINFVEQTREIKLLQERLKSSLQFILPCYSESFINYVTNNSGSFEGVSKSSDLAGDITNIILIRIERLKSSSSLIPSIN